jgi:hypothetical protein
VLLSVPWSRIAAAAGLVAVSAALYWVTSDATFAVDPRAIPITGARYSGEAAVRSAMALPDDLLVNIFRIPTSDLEARIEALPAVRSATVTATLPDQVAVSVEERRPMLVWRTTRAAWLVDGDGRLFAPATAAPSDELGTGATGTALPAIDDRRVGGSLALGGRVADLDLEVARLLLTVTPEMVGSAARELHLWMDDARGYVLEAPGEWQATFGPYTPDLRSPAMIPRQVQCLGALLASREEEVGVVTLALSDETCGTFQERTTPRATARPGRPEMTPKGRRPADDGTPRP